MTNKEKINGLCSQIENKEKEVADYAKYVNPNFINELRKLKENFAKNAKSKESEGRLLKIGVIGQIKRGKSSFLNALLFNGDDVLPKAATPMTAALTKIRYSENISAKIEFYTAKDWEEIEVPAKAAKELLRNPDCGEISEEDKVCLEIYEDAIQTGIINEIGCCDKVLTGLKKPADLLSKLEDYVGANGKYTPIVKSTELNVNIEELKGIEIVDTPGTNDPVISRGRKTKDFIGECDAVFFLTLCPQFLDSSDMSLLAQNIPNNGIENIFLVGTLFDSVMLEEHEKSKTIQNLIGRLQRGYKARAIEQAKLARTNNYDSSFCSALEDASNDFFCISSMAFNIATHFDNLSKEEYFNLTNLNKMYSDFNFSKGDLFSISNISMANDKLKFARNNKDKIISKGVDKLITGATTGYESCIEKKLKEVKEDYETFANNDIADLDAKQNAINKSIDKGKIKVKNVFDEYTVKIEKDFSDVKYDIKQAANSAGRVETENKSEQGTEEYHVEPPWWKFWSDGSYRTRTVTVNYKSASVHNAIQKLEDFVLSSEKQIQHKVKTIIDIETFRKKMLKTVSGLFDTSDDDFDPQDILQALNTAVNRITIPNIDIDCAAHIQTVRKKFIAGDVRDSQINELISEQQRVIKLILGDINSEVSEQMNKIISKLSEVNSTFLPDLLKTFNDKLEVMKKDKENQDKVIAEYNAIIQILS